MADTPSDLSALTVDELLQEYVRQVQLFWATKHAGRRKRLSIKKRRIVEILRSRGERTLRLLLPLREHPDPFVGLSVTILGKSQDLDSYRETSETLFKRRDEIGEQAQSALFWDWWVEENVFKPAKPTQYPPGFLRRSASEVPTGITQGELETLVCAEFPDDLARAVLALAKPTIGAWPRQLKETTDPSASRLGGMPYVPEDWIWPTLGEEPMLFVGYVNCAELAALPPARAFPASGLITFFADHDFIDGPGVDGEPKGCAVFHWPEAVTLTPATEPIEDFQRLPSCGLAFYETYSLPDLRSRQIDQLPFDRGQRQRYAKLQETVRAHGVKDQFFSEIDTSKLLGWPDLVQYDFLPRSDRPDSDRLLLQLGSYDGGTTPTHYWGSGGLVYFSIPDEDLTEGRFDRVRVEMQCT